MQTLEQVLSHLGFHPATQEAAEKYDEIRTAFVELAQTLWPLLPDGPDKTVAFRQLHLAQMLTIAAVAVNETPVDWVNPQVARVLPHGGVALATEGVMSMADWVAAGRPGVDVTESSDPTNSSTSTGTPSSNGSSDASPQPSGETAAAASAADGSIPSTAPAAASEEPVS